MKRKEPVFRNKKFLITAIASIAVVVGLLLYAIFSDASNTGNILTVITGALIGGAALAFGAVAVWQTRQYNERADRQATIQVIISEKASLERLLDGFMGKANITDLLFEYNELISKIDFDKKMLFGRVHKFTRMELAKVLSLRTAIERDKTFYENKLELLLAIERFKDIVMDIRNSNFEQVESKLGDYYEFFNGVLGQFAVFLDRAGVLVREYSKLDSMDAIVTRQEEVEKENVKIITEIFRRERITKNE
jgi:hypothetical protein